MRHTVVERELELRLVLSPERSIPVPARPDYRSDDSYAVHVTFHGDVRVWPATADGHRVVLPALSSPDGDALLRAPVPQVSAWLERTLRVVPPGTEGGRLGIDGALDELLAR
ncbi:SsgA family sporulation/cell division regulator [Streptomyces sp. NPDC058299]|uniref:SsgA family sporulation/cell division regulator n=1 Tax=unclassified Streptomyces TaxID=2593676 RepID=UPI0036E2C174